MIKFIDEFFKFTFLLLLIAWLWQELEILMLGKINPNNVDTIVCCILTFSIYLNLKHWNK